MSTNLNSLFFGAVQKTDRNKRIANNPIPQLTAVAGAGTGKNKLEINGACSNLIGLGNREYADVISNKGSIDEMIVNSKPNAELKDWMKEQGLNFNKWKDGDLTQSPYRFFLLLASPKRDGAGEPIETRDKRLINDEIKKLMKDHGYVDESQILDEDYPLVTVMNGFRMSTNNVERGKKGYNLMGNDEKNWNAMGGNESNHIIYNVGEGIKGEELDETLAETVCHPLIFDHIEPKQVKLTKSE